MNNEEKRKVEGMMSQGETLISCAVTRLYTGKSKIWTKIEKSSPYFVTISRKNSSYYISLYPTAQSTPSPLICQEFYSGFEYTAPKRYFHAFESNDDVCGLSFADEDEASALLRCVLQCKSKMPASLVRNPSKITLRNSGNSNRSFLDESGGTIRSSGNVKSVPSSNPQPGHLDAKGFISEVKSRFASDPQRFKQFLDLLQGKNNPNQVLQEAERLGLFTGHPDLFQQFRQFLEKKGGQTDSPQLSRKPSVTKLTKQEKRDRAEARKRQKREEKLKKQQALEDKKRPGARMKIEGPTNVAHVSHMGWDPKNGFQLVNIPPEWKRLFQAAGVKKSDLANPETAAMIVETVNAAMAPPAATQMHPTATKGRTPPAPPTQKATPTTRQLTSRRPPPPPQPSRSRLPPSPPVAPAAPIAPAAPPPPSGAALMIQEQASSEETDSGGERGGLLAQIRGGATLKKVSANEPLPQLDSTTSDNILQTLSSAMAARRIAVDDKGQEVDSDDDWSDDSDVWD